jgi:hypothetical protein
MPKRQKWDTEQEPSSSLLCSLRESLPLSTKTLKCNLSFI